MFLLKVGCLWSSFKAIYLKNNSIGINLIIFHIGNGEILFLLIGIGEFVFFISVLVYVMMSISVSVSVK